MLLIYRDKLVFPRNDFWTIAAKARENLPQILNEERLQDDDVDLMRKARHYSAMEQTYVVDLMNKFELCFELEDHTILVPDLLKEKDHQVLRQPYQEHFC